LRGLIEVYLQLHPNESKGEEYPAVMYCGFAFNDIFDGDDRIPLRSFYEMVLRVLRAVEKASPDVQALLQTKIRHPVVYAGIAQTINGNNLDISPLTLNKEWIKYYEPYDAERTMIRDVETLPTIKDTADLLERFMEVDPIDGDDVVDNPCGDHWMIFGMGFSIKQSTAFLQILDSIGTFPMGDAEGVGIPGRDFFEIKSIPRGAIRTIEYDPYDGEGIVSADEADLLDLSRGIDSGVENRSCRIFTYRFM
jgi:hypothetical protein